MFIISKFKDYYDGALGVTGIDKSIIYNRTSIDLEKIPLEAYKPLVDRRNNWYHSRNYSIRLNSSNKQHVDVDYFLVGFCGKYYLGFRFYSLVKNDPLKSLTYEIKYNLDEVRPLLDLNNSRKWSWDRRGDHFEELVKNVAQYNDETLFRLYKTPSFIYYPSTQLYKSSQGNNAKFTVNPMLKDFQFAKVFDPYTTFQEIQMYISGVLGVNEKETITISDKDRIAAHGFDKWSFRKPPEKD